MERFDEKLKSFELYGKVAVGLFAGMLAALIADILVRLWIAR